MDVLIPFSTISNTSMSVNYSNFTPVFFIAASYANQSADKKRASSYILKYIFLKFSNTSARNNISP